MRGFRFGLLATTAFCCMTAGDALAQEVPRNEPTALGEIVVTAERRSVNLQDVPVAVSAYTTERRDQLGITTTQDIARFTPGMSYADFPNRVFLRGIGRFINSVGSDPGVAVYVDGVYTSETASIGSPPMFVNRVEVLRGPQGTLYGRNSIGGAVNVISPRPTEAFRGEFRQTFGSLETSQTELALSGPITDQFRYRLSGFKSDNDGYVRNASGPNQADLDVSYIEAQLEYDVTQDFGLWLKYSTSTIDSRPTTGVQIDPYLTTTYFSGSSLLPSATFGYATPNPSVGDIHRVDYDYAGHLKINDQHSVTLQATWDIGGAQLKYVGGYSTYSFFQDSDYDRTSRASYAPFGVGATAFTSRIETITEDKSNFSNELTLSSTGEGRLRWIAGLYQYKEEVEQSYDLSSPNQTQLDVVLNRLTLMPTGVPNPGRRSVDLDASLDASSYAAFGQVDYDLTSQLRLTAGLRYTRDKKTGFESRRYVLWGPFTAAALGYGPFAPVLENLFSTCCSIDTTPDVAARTIDGEWDGFTGRLGLQWRPDDATLIYGSVSQGYKSGGFNLYGFTPPVDDERLTAFEAGFKKTFASPFQLNGAAFLYNYEDLQVPTKIIVGGVIQDNFVNADKARSYGLELEAIWAPTDALQFLLSYSHLKTEFTRFCCVVDVANAAAGAQDLQGARIPQSPENKLALNGLYRFDFTPGSLSLVATYAYVGEQFFSPFNTDKYRSPSYQQTDFRMVWDDAQHRFSLIGYLRNAFDEDAFNGLDIGPEDTGFARRVTVNPPRTYGVELQYRF